MAFSLEISGDFVQGRVPPQRVWACSSAAATARGATRVNGCGAPRSANHLPPPPSAPPRPKEHPPFSPACPVLYFKTATRPAPLWLVSRLPPAPCRSAQRGRLPPHALPVHQLPPRHDSAPLLPWLSRRACGGLFIASAVPPALPS